MTFAQPHSKVLVTGADGFIGSHLTESLVRAGHRVRAFVLYNSFNSWGWQAKDLFALIEKTFSGKGHSGISWLFQNLLPPKLIIFIKQHSLRSSASVNGEQYSHLSPLTSPLRRHMHDLIRIPMSIISNNVGSDKIAYLVRGVVWAISKRLGISFVARL